MSTSDKNNKDNHQNKKDKKIDKKPHVLDRTLQRSEEARTVRKIVTIVLVLITLAIVSGGVTGYLYIKSALEPVNPDDETTTSIEIPLGSSTSQIANILEENGIIKDPRVYRFYIKFNNAGQFQAGEYQLSPSMTLGEITDALQTGRVYKEPVLTVTIPEGKTIEQIADLYAEKADVDKEAFLARVEDKTFIRQLIDAYPTILSEEILNEDIRTPLEGYLYAATYQFYEENPSVDTIINKMLDKTEDVVLNYYDQISQMEEWTVHDAITMASLVENEARTEEDRKIIAGVFYNRLEQGMMLQTDPTVLYALGEHRDRVLYEYLEIESPYNTYQITGLPVGPISNFNENSLRAVIEPEETNYMYFVAANDGNIYYSETYEKHQELVARYLNRDAVEAE
ncbi:endolytic transglycosylase MltG [Aquibacillus albus]|uniref:Endolytic murein transglycosylase n=1 Tax=Aquibacillus albus TaxID=1168171 RepID=A0ABS2MUU2_9BACI|nr:endolytic transglycosylase MltG [Aquibacillus albus]MBM7569573.1 UPF0755 protein [Aquibacillus albus]